MEVVEKKEGEVVQEVELVEVEGGAGVFWLE